MQTFYFLYKITNQINNKIYLGKHKTKNLDDGYFGSGKLLKRAITKYGKENFSFEILELFNSEEELNQAEKELITEEFCQRDDNYNLCVGGKGGFSYINRTLTKQERITRAKIASRAGVEARTEETKQRALKTRRKRFEQGMYDTSKRSAYLKQGIQDKFGVPNVSLVPSVVEKRKLTYRKNLHSQGKRNSQYGTIWITDGALNKKQKALDQIPEGWYKGRVK